MKKLLMASLLASAFPMAALADSCDDYFKYMEETLKKDGSYSDEAMKVVKDQIAAIPADQKEAVCKAAQESMKEDAAADGSEKEESEEAKS